MIPRNDAELREYNARLAELKARGTVRTHSCDDDDVIGFGKVQDARPASPRLQGGTNGGQAVPKVVHGQKTRQITRKSLQRSNLEVMLQDQIEKAGLVGAEYDVPYLIGTRHRLDVCFRVRKFGVEVQGMPHRIKERFRADIEKRALGLLQGWTILEVDRVAIENGKAIEWIGQLLKR